MRKTIIFIIAVLTVSIFFNILSQPVLSIEPGTIEWEKTFGDSEMTNKGTLVNQTKDGGYIILADDVFSVEGSGLRTDVRVIKTNSNGYKIWDRTYSRPSNFYTRSGKYIIETSEDEYLLIVKGHDFGVGEWPYTWVVKLNEYLLNEWDTTLSRFSFSTITQISDGSYLLGGKGVVSGYPRILKLNQNGDAEWDQEYWISTDSINSIWELDDGNYLLSTNNGQLIKIGNNGSKIWNKNTPYSYLKIYDKLSNNECLLLGKNTTIVGNASYVINPSQYNNIYLLKCDDQGNITWEKKICQYSNNKFTLWNWSIDTTDLDLSRYKPSFSIIPSSDDNYLVIVKRSTYYPGMTETNYKSPLWIVSTNRNGNDEWRAMLEDVPAESVQQTNDEGFILLGMKSDDIWLMKTTNDVKMENQLPSVEILSPNDGDIVGGNITVSGTAYDPEDSIQCVQIKTIPGSDWETVIGTANWNYTWDTSEFSMENITIYARSYDGYDYSIEDQISVKIDQNYSSDGGNIPAFELIFVIIAAALVLFWRRKK